MYRPIHPLLAGYLQAYALGLFGYLFTVTAAHLCNLEAYSDTRDSLSSLPGNSVSENLLRKRFVALYSTNSEISESFRVFRRFRCCTMLWCLEIAANLH